MSLLESSTLQKGHGYIWRDKTIYRRTGFDCEYLLNVNCEFFYDSQSFDNAIINLITAQYTRLHQYLQSLDSQCRQTLQNAIIKPRI